MALLMKPEPFSSEINRLFDTLFEPVNGNANRSQQRWVPAMDLVEADDHFLLKADLPGLAEDDVTIEVQDNVLTVSGERKTEHERKEKGSTVSSVRSAASAARSRSPRALTPIRSRRRSTRACSR
jgi:HSP20 family protein